MQKLKKVCQFYYSFFVKIIFKQNQFHQMKNNKSLFKIATICMIAAFAFNFVSCKKGIDATFDKDFANINFVVSKDTAKGSFTTGGANVTTGISQMASDKGFSLNNIQSVKIKTCTLTINDTTSNPTISNPKVTFSMIDSISAQLSSTGLSTIAIAKNSGSLTGTTLSMNLNSLDVTSYIKANTFSFNVVGHTNAPVPHDVPMTADVTFEITASVIQ